MLETAYNHGLVCQKMRTDTSFLTANMSHSAFAKSKTMETFHPDMSKYVKSCTRTRPRTSKWCRVISWSVVVISRFSWSVVLRGQSFFLVVVVSHFLWSVSRLNRCGQSSYGRAQSTWSSWSVVVVSCSSWSVVHLARRGQSFFVDGVYILWWLCTRIY